MNEVQTIVFLLMIVSAFVGGMFAGAFAFTGELRAETKKLRKRIEAYEKVLKFERRNTETLNIQEAE